MHITKSKKAVLTHAVQPCRYPRPTLGANLMFWFRLLPATKAPRSRPSPRCSAEEKWKERGRNWWVGIRAV